MKQFKKAILRKELKYWIIAKILWLLLATINVLNVAYFEYVFIMKLFS